MSGRKSYEERRDLIFAKQAARKRRAELRKKGCYVLFALIAFILIFKMATLSGKAQDPKEIKRTTVSDEIGHSSSILPYFFAL